MSVLGAGIIGLLTAIECAKRGLIVSVFADRIPTKDEEDVLKMCTSEMAPGFWCPNHL